MNPIRLSLVVSLSSLLVLPLTNACTPLWANNNATEKEVAQLDSNQLKQIAQEITVRVLSGGNQSSGVLIARSGQNYTVVTNTNSLTPGEPAQIQTPDGKVYQATLTTPEEAEVENDIALLQFSAESDYAIAEIETNANLAAGETVFTAGFLFDSQQLQLTRGEISLLSEKPIEGGYSIGYTNEIGQGMSGGAILNSQGKLIGINGKIPYAILDTAYEFEDGSNPDEQQLQRMRQLAWGLPVETITAVAPQLAGLWATTSPNLTGVSAQVDEIAAKITVLINIPDGSNGSGAIIARQDDTYYILTAAHVVEKEEHQYTVVTHDGEEYRVAPETVTVLPGADLAVVQFTSNRDYQVATLGRYNFEVFDKRWIFLSGFPGVENDSLKQPQRRLTAGKVFSREGSATAARNLYSLTDINGYGLVYNNLSQGGMSGGAVLDSRGRLIGIHAAAEAEAVIQESGEVAQFNLGRSLGVPIATFLGMVEQANIKPQWLAVETDQPTKLDKSEVEAIQSSLFTFQAPAGDATEIDWLDYGNQLWRAERYGEAIAAFDRAIEIQPDFEQAYYAKGVAFSSQQKSQKAIAAYTKAIEINPRFYEALRGRSFRYYVINQPTEALADLESAIALQPDDWTLYWQRATTLISSYYDDQGELYFHNAALEEAIEAANEALAINPDTPLPYLVRGSAYERLGELDLALADLNHALEVNSDNWLAYFIRGSIFNNLDNPQEAIADYNRAVELNPQYYDVYWIRASIYWALEQYEEAFADLEQAIKLEPERTDSYEIRGLFYTALGEYESAIADYTKIIELTPESRKPYEERGLAYINLEKYEDAIADFTRALELKPESANAYLYKDADNIPEYQRNLSVQENSNIESYRQRGYAYVLLQQFDAAVADFTQAIKINPEDSLLYSLRGGVYAFTEKYEQAIADYSQAIELSKKYLARSESSQGDEESLRDSLSGILANHYSSRGELYYQLKEYDKAIADYTQVIELNPQDAESYFTRGVVYHRQANYQKALSDYQQATALKEDFLPAYVNRGLIQYERGDEESAAVLWLQSLEINSEAAEPLLAMAVALYASGSQDEQNLEMARAALAKDPRLADIDYLKKNLWGDRLIAATQILLKDSR